jgi:hypothetical protein
MSLRLWENKDRDMSKPLRVLIVEDSEDDALADNPITEKGRLQSSL